MTRYTLFALLLLAALGSGCSISRNVTPVESSVQIHSIYVLENDRVHMEGLLDELLEQIELLGFQSHSYSGDRPAGAKHYLTYTANWNWDMAMYLTYFRATLYEEGRVLGEAEYDARAGGGNMSKFGRTGEKIRPLLEEMLREAQRVDPSVTPVAKAPAMGN